MNDLDQMMNGLIDLYNNYAADPLGLPFYIPDNLKKDVDTTERPRLGTGDRAPNFDPPGTMDQPIRQRGILPGDQWELVPHENTPEEHIPKRKRT